jgi:hypothetical protein
MGSSVVICKAAAKVHTHFCAPRILALNSICCWKFLPDSVGQLSARAGSAALLHAGVNSARTAASPGTSALHKCTECAAV